MSSHRPKPSFDARRYRGQVERELIVGGILITLVVGGGLIALLWGAEAFFVALMCFISALLLASVVWGVLKLIEMVSRD
jgi:CHASE2 domain-containing sensor protein